MTAAVLIL
jgi:hypothetical protein